MDLPISDVRVGSTAIPVAPKRNFRYCLHNGHCRQARLIRSVPEADVLHSITSSARARIEGGMVRPSALAVFRLMTSWYLEACSTGRSAGFAPLRILSM